MQMPVAFKKLIIACTFFVSMVGYGQMNTAIQNPNASYQAPSFTDKERLQKLQSFFPLVDEIYKRYADKNHFPGYAFGIVLDGKLVYSGSGGYADIDKKIPH